MTEPTDAELDAVLCNQWPAFSMQATLVRVWVRAAMRDALAKWATPPALEALAAWNRRVAPATMLGEPVFAFRRKGLDDFCTCTEKRYAELSLKPKLFETRIFYTTPQPTQAQAGSVPLTDREIELIDGMIQVQLNHASRCDAIANRSMADKQKGWDMERVALLQKLKAHGIKGGQHG